MTRIGFAACTAGENEAQRYLKVPNLAIQCEYLQYINWTWTTGMLDPAWVNRGTGAEKLIMSVPPLVGPALPLASPVAGSGSGQTTSPQNPSNANVPTTMTLTDVANGVWDSLYLMVFAMIAAIRPDCILRIGWEQYGNGWYPWTGVAIAAEYKAAYRHLVALARSVSASFTFDWNGNIAFATWNPATTPNAYPGDDVCDILTFDVYDSYDPGGAQGWIDYRNAVMTQALNFAKSHGKPLGISEFGIYAVGFDNGYGDDPAWLKEAYYWLRQNEADIAYALFFMNYGGNATTDGSSALQRNPQTAAVFTSLFGAWARQNAGLDAKRFVSSGVNRFRTNH